MRYMELKNDFDSWEEFLNKLSGYYPQERGFSRILPLWAKHPKKYKWVIEIAKLRDLNYYPADINLIINIIRTLVKLNKADGIDYPGMVLDARLIFDQRKLEIDGYMKKFPFIYDNVMSKERAEKELLARGFKPLSQARLSKDMPYIRSNGFDLVYPRQFSKDINNPFGGIYEKLGRIGITGHNGITFPKKLKSKAK